MFRILDQKERRLNQEAANKSMGERDNLELVQGIYTAFARGDMTAVLAPFADRLAFHHPMPQSIWPWAGTRSGRQGLVEFFAGLSATLEYERLQPYQFIAQDESVAVVLSERTRIKATGLFFEISEVHLYTLENGKVVQLTIFEDTAPILAALQVHPR